MALRSPPAQGGQGRLKGLDREVAGSLSQARRLGGRQHRGDLDLLPPTLGPSPQHEVDQHARALQRGDPAPHAGGADLSQRGELPPVGAGARRRAARALAGGSPLPQHDLLEGGATGEIEDGRLSLARVHQGDHAIPLSAILARSLDERARWLRGDHGSPETMTNLLNLTHTTNKLVAL